jgi:hypothetical protein
MQRDLLGADIHTRRKAAADLLKVRHYGANAACILRFQIALSV